MFETMTFDYLMTRTLSRTPADFDRREGSIFYNAVAPAVAELAQVYIRLDVLIDEAFADTASRPYLIRKAGERGMIPKPESAALVKGRFNIAVPEKSRFYAEDYIYQVKKRLDTGDYQLECETPGSLPNGVIGRLIPIDYIKGLESAEIVELLVPGEEEEETEHFRQRYYNSLETQAFGGNVADYKEKLNAIAGIGGVKVYRAWQGGGTVKIVILTSDYKKPSADFVATIQEMVDPIEHTGEGYGIAPIDHCVTVFPAEETIISLQVNLVYQSGSNFDLCKEAITEMVDAYFLELNKAWGKSDGIVVRITQIEKRLLDLPGILDVTEVQMNHIAANISVREGNFVVRGEICGETST